MCKYCDDVNGKPTGIWASLTPYEEAQIFRVLWEEVDRKKADQYITNIIFCDCLIHKEALAKVSMEYIIKTVPKTKFMKRSKLLGSLEELNKILMLYFLKSKYDK